MVLSVYTWDVVLGFERVDELFLSINGGESEIKSRLPIKTNPVHCVEGLELNRSDFGYY